MPLEVGCSKAVVKRNIAKLRREGYSRQQAVAIAYDLARKYRKLCSLARQKKLRRPRRKRQALFGGLF